MTRRKTSAEPAMPASVQKRRCAVYTRKSTDEGLEKEFNTLDAQRESCEAYIASQRAEGWVLVPHRYDDGGFSGGSLERPALQRLMRDIEVDQVDERQRRARVDFRQRSVLPPSGLRSSLRAGDGTPPQDAQAMDLEWMDPNAAITLAAMSGSLTLGQFGRSHPRLVQRFSSLDPVAAVANFAGMLTRLEVRASSLRLEVLVALAVRHGNGDRRPTREMLSRAFKEAGAGWAGRAEDPAEDVVVARVTGARGDFSILPGLAEGAADCLDRFLDVVDHMPEGNPWDDLREEVYALLALSDEAVRRSGRAVHDIGAELPVRTLPAAVADAMAHARAAVTFTPADLVVFRDPVAVGVRKSLIPEVKMTLFADLATI